MPKEPTLYPHPQQKMVTHDVYASSQSFIPLAPSSGYPWADHLALRMIEKAKQK